MSFRHLWEGTDGNSWIARLDGRTKLSFLFLFAIMMVLVDNSRTLFILFTSTIVLHFMAGTPIYKWKVLATFILLGLWGSIASQALFFNQHPKTPIVMLISPTFPVLGSITDGLYIYREGLIYGAVQGMRSVSMISLGLLVCWTSDPRQLLKGLTSWHLSPQVAFMLVTAIRFFPVLASEAGEVLVALQLRSRNPAGRHQVVRHLPYLIKPLLARCLRRSQTLALSVTSRGLFVAKNTAGDVWRLPEKAACFLFLAAVLLAGSGKLLYYASQQGMYYGSLRFIYDLTKVYL